MTEYVTTADLLLFHQQLIERYGGSSGLRDVGALESALHRPLTSYYDTTIDEAAALLESLAPNNPFVDGNKRVAFAVLDVSADQLSHDQIGTDAFVYQMWWHALPLQMQVPDCGDASHGGGEGRMCNRHLAFGIWHLARRAEPSGQESPPLLRYAV